MLKDKLRSFLEDQVDFNLLKNKETKQLINALELDLDINLAVLFGSYAKGTFNLESV